MSLNIPLKCTLDLLLFIFILKICFYSPYIHFSFRLSFRNFISKEKLKVVEMYVSNL